MKGHSEEAEVLRDGAGVYVLLSNDYTYLGKDAMEVATLYKYNAKRRENRIYVGVKTEEIVKACWDCEDGNVHEPHEKVGECKRCGC